MTSDTSLSNSGTAMSLYQIQATDGVVNGGRVTVKGEMTVTHKPEQGWDGDVAVLSDGGTAMLLYQIQATDEVVNGGRVTVKGEMPTCDTQA